MSRLEAVLGALVLVAATILVTEWVHFRLGDTTLWNALPATSGAGSVQAPSEAGILQPVTESEFERYLHVLERMQSNRELSIDEAVASEDISVPQFREVEQRVQRNGALVDRTREHLRNEAERLWDSRLATLGQG